MIMLLTIDVGNSNLVAVGYDQFKNRIFDSRIITQKQNVSHYYGEWFEELLGKQLINKDLQGIIISSVVPDITEDICRILFTATQIQPIVVNVDLVNDFVIHLYDPRQIGSDFIATAYGAIASYRLPALVADLGSATKISVINKHGEFEGGIIQPGIGISLEGLVNFVKHLPTIELKLPNQVIGKDTIEAMQSGLLWGAIASIEGLANQIEAQVNQPMTRIITGGYAKIIAPAVKDFIYDEFLLNDGLFDIYQRRINS